MYVRKLQPVVAMVGLAALVGCQTTRPVASEDGVKPIRAYVVHHIEHAFDQLAKDFERETGILVDVEYACRRTLYKTLVSKNKDGDLYVDSRPANLEQARKDGLARGEVFRIGVLMPVIEVAKGNPKKIEGLSDLSRSGMHVSLGAEAACMGRIAARILRENNLSDKVKPNVVRYVMGETNIAKSVDGKEIDATIIWRSTVREVRGSDVDVVEIPRDGNVIDPIEAVVLTTGENPSGAERFAEFLRSRQARHRLKLAGFAGR